MKMLCKIKQPLIAIMLCMSASLCYAQIQGRHTPMAPIPSKNIDNYFYRYLPPGYDSTDTQKKYPLMVFMHGLGQRARAGYAGVDIDSVLKYGPPREIKAGKEMCFRVRGVTECFIVLSPQLVAPNFYWNSEPADLVKYAVETLNADPGRIYITGLSMGGISTINYAQNLSSWPYTDRIAAIAVAPGGEIDISGTNECLFDQRDIPMWAAHVIGDQTSLTKYTDVYAAVQAINACSPSNPRAFFSPLPAQNNDYHNAWSRFYSTGHSYFIPNVYEWFLLNPESANDKSPFDVGAWAGDDRLITKSGFTLDGKGMDNNDASGALTYRWKKVSGGNANLADTTARQCAVTGLTPGIYKFRLTVSDDSTSNYDIVTITVNAAPTANAGADQTITLPLNNVLLNGTGTDLEGPVTFLWQKTQGGNAVIANPTSASTSVTGLEAGVYKFLLTVTDNVAATKTDEVMITVNQATQTGTKTWNSWDIVMQDSTYAFPGSVINSEGTTSANLEFYVSSDLNGVTKNNLLPYWFGKVHPDNTAYVANYWATQLGTNNLGKVYPYAGKSTVGRGNELGEGTAPLPLNVLDLQLHPPVDNYQTVAAFIAPESGTYKINNLGVRRLVTSGNRVAFRIYNPQKQLLTEIVTIEDSRQWQTSPSTFDLGHLAAGERIYFATHRYDQWDYDMTEVSWSVSMTPTPQSWHSYDIVLQNNTDKPGVVNSNLGTEATVKLYETLNESDVATGTAFAAFNPTVHNDPSAKVQNYWSYKIASPTERLYPYAGKSTIKRGDETGETNVPSPLNVYDLQLHPPRYTKLTVAAFVAPQSGTYSISNLGIRRLSLQGATVKFKVYTPANTQTPLVTLTTTDDSQAWFTSPSTTMLGHLEAGQRIYFVTDKADLWDYDMTEVTFTVHINGGAGTSGSSLDEAVLVQRANEELKTFYVSVFDGQGRLLRQFKREASAGEIENSDLRTEVSQSGFYIFRIHDEKNNLITRKVIFTK